MRLQFNGAQLFIEDCPEVGARTEVPLAHSVHYGRHQAVVYDDTETVIVWGNGEVLAPPGWRLAERRVPSATPGRDNDANIVVATRDGRLIADGDLAPSDGLITVTTRLGPGTPGGPPGLRFTRVHPDGAAHECGAVGQTLAANEGVGRKMAAVRDRRDGRREVRVGVNEGP